MPGRRAAGRPGQPRRSELTIRPSRRVLIGGTAAAAALLGAGSALPAAGELASRLAAEALAATLEARLPPGSDVSWRVIEADPAGGVARLRDLAVRLGPPGGR